MRFLLTSLVYALCFCTRLLAVEAQEMPETPSVATTEGLPNSLVNKAVCVITGEYVDHVVDAVLPGPEPLVIERTYSSLDSKTNLGIGWCHNHADELQATTGIDKGCLWYFILNRPTGPRLVYAHPFLNKKHLKEHTSLEYQLLVPKGLTNGAHNEISGRTNLRNQKAIYHVAEHNFTTISGDGVRHHYDLFKKKDDTSIYRQSHAYKLNRSCLIYQYDQEKPFIKKFSSITCANVDTKQVYSKAYFEPKAGKFKDHLTAYLKTSDDKTVTYRFLEHKRKHEDYYCYLEEVERPHAAWEKYEYREKSDHDLQLSKKEIGFDGRYLSIGYYAEGGNYIGGPVQTVTIEDKYDYRLDRVRSLRAPVGTDKTPVTLYHFVYDIKKEKNAKGEKELLDGKTDVFDAYWHRTSYAFNKEHRLTAIRKYLGDYKYHLFSTEGYIWGEQGSSNEGNLVGKYLQEGEGRLHHGQFFSYDESGNILVKSLYGHLTGLPTPDLVLNKHQKPIENGCEKEIKTYTYSTDGFNLLKTETDSNGVKTVYDYLPGTDLLSSKLIVYQNQVQSREFYHYDENGVVIKKIVDDGKGYQEGDLTSLTQRLITYIIPRKKAPIGLPECVEEKYLDVASGKEKLLKKTLCKYSKEGYLLKQDIYDAQENYCFSLEWDYDAHGNVILEKNAFGEKTIKTYDEYDNLIFEKSPGKEYTLHNTYDYANRLIRQEERHTDGTVLVTTHRYNYLSLRTATVDSYGHETKYEYDDLGRLVKTFLPPIADETGALVNPVVCQQYNVAGYPTHAIDAKTRKTVTDYNSRGQPIRIVYPDGTEERFLYQLDGKLAQKIEKNGLRTVYTRDYQGRVLKEEAYGANGELLHVQAWTYSAFHPLSFIDAMGTITTYQYDGAGRLQLVAKGERLQEYVYDARGRLIETKEWTGLEPKDYRRHVRVYDGLDRVIEEHLEDPSGHVWQRECTEYDTCGRKISVTSGTEKTSTRYNTHGNPIEIINAKGESTHIKYNLSFVNEWKQRVLQTTTTDPLGYQIVHTYDTANRLVDEKRFNPFGIKTAHQHLFYDLAGNCCRTVDDAIVEGKVVKSIETLCLYTEGDQLSTLIEAAHTPEQKTLRYLYNLYGQKAATLKPDGICLYYDYDAKGQLACLKASNGSVWYTYEYNALGQVVEAVDHCHQLTTERFYDQMGELMCEELGNGLKMSYEYDRVGRLRLVTLPDQTGIEYVYQAADVKEIHRLVQGKRTYSHLDEKHNSIGLPLSSQLPGQNGSIEYKYDVLNRCVSIESEHFKQQVPKEGYDAAGNLLKYQIDGTLHSFSYDDLYQLKAEKGHAEHTYQCDSLSNRLLKDGQVHAVNSLHQVVQRGNDTYRYDANGNLTQKKQNGIVTQYAYDALDRLVSVSSQGMSVSYIYDAFNRRLIKKCAGQMDQHFFYMGQEEMGAWENGAITELKVISKGKRHPAVALELKAQVYVPVQDLLGHIVCLSTLQGELVERYRYTAFGEREIVDASGCLLDESAVGNPWCYANRRFDKETGLVYFGMRYYDPDLGRWLSPDPAGSVDGPNLYAYVHHRPLFYYDELGQLADILVYGAYSLLRYFNSQSLNAPVNYQQWEPNQPYAVEEGLLSYCSPEKGIPFSFVSNKPFVLDLNRDAINPKTGQPFNLRQDPSKYIVLLSGICNSVKDTLDSAAYLGELGNYNVISVVHPSQSFWKDVYHCKLSLVDSIVGDIARVTRQLLDDIFANSPPNSEVCLVPHSGGAIYLNKVLRSYPPELRARISIVAVAPGGYIPPSLCRDVVHLVSTRDIVPHLDFWGRIRYSESIIRLTPHPDAKLWDHSFNSPTYASDLQTLINNFHGQ